MSEATIEYKNGPNESTAYAVSEGQKTKVQMVATPAGDLELAESPNVDTGYIVIDGKKHKCALVAEVAGELKLPTSATDDTGYVIAQDGRQHKVKLVANITGGGGGGATINNQDITVTKNGTYTADEGYTGLGTVEVQVPNPSTGTLSIVENGSYDVTEYATAEVNVPTGGGATTKFGVSIDNIFPVEGSALSRPITPTTDQQFSLNMDGITKINAKALAYKFYYNNAITGAEFPDLVEIYGDEACYGAFLSCQNLKVISAPKLETIDGASACEDMFSFNGIDGQVSLPSLKTIRGSSACRNMFSHNSGIIGVSMPNLTTIDGYNACVSMFKNTGLTRVDFPALTTITNANSLGTRSTDGMFADCTGLLEIHFRADAQATIEGLSGYSSKFGASSASIFFDL